MARPAPALLASRGIRFALRYLAAAGNAKRLTRAEYDALTAAGLEVPYLYEYDGEELLGGYAAGINAATLAEQHRTSENLPAKPIILNADFAVQDAQIPVILDALRGAATVLGLGRTWLYGGYRIVKAAFDADVISGGMQAYAWSQDQDGNTLWDPRAQLQQWANDQFDGQVDFTRAVAPHHEQETV